MKVLVFDNYDSFTFNLVHYLEKTELCTIEVYRNNEISLDQVEQFDKIVISPGPGLPKDAGILMPLLKQYSFKKSILGICLGHQAIAESFGGELFNLTSVQHGIQKKVRIIKSDPIFSNIPNSLEVGLYHSWAVSKNNLPEELEVLSEDENGTIMAMRHKIFNLKGIQFHPESIMTPLGEQILRNWLLEPLKNN